MPAKKQVFTRGVTGRERTPRLGGGGAAAGGFVSAAESKCPHFNQ